MGGSGASGRSDVRDQWGLFAASFLYIALWNVSKLHTQSELDNAVLDSAGPRLNPGLKTVELVDGRLQSGTQRVSRRDDLGVVSCFGLKEFRVQSLCGDAWLSLLLWVGD